MVSNLHKNLVRRKVPDKKEDETGDTGSTESSAVMGTRMSSKIVISDKIALCCLSQMP